MITSFIKKAIRKSFSSFGYDIVRHEVCDGSSANLVRDLELRNIDLVLDVGANTGIYASALFAYGYKGRIVSFEPGSEAYGQLLARSQGKQLWQVAEQGALGDIDSEIEINISTNLESSSILPMLNACEEAAPDARYRSKERVMLRSLDSVAEKYLAGAKAPFLKLDVQGFEDKILAGGKNTLPKIKGVQIELSLVPLYEGQKLWRELVDQLIDSGFVLHTILPGFTDYKTGRLLQMDGIFFRS
jgi:FkbM family methyltransferase